MAWDVSTYLDNVQNIITETDNSNRELAAILQDFADRIRQISDEIEPLIRNNYSILDDFRSVEDDVEGFDSLSEELQDACYDIWEDLLSCASDQEWLQDSFDDLRTELEAQYEKLDFGLVEFDTEKEYDW